LGICQGYTSRRRVPKKVLNSIVNTVVSTGVHHSPLLLVKCQPLLWSSVAVVAHSQSFAGQCAISTLVLEYQYLTMPVQPVQFLRDLCWLLVTMPMQPAQKFYGTYAGYSSSTIAETYQMVIRRYSSTRVWQNKPVVKCFLKVNPQDLKNTSNMGTSV